MGKQTGNSSIDLQIWKSAIIKNIEGALRAFARGPEIFWGVEKARSEGFPEEVVLRAKMRRTRRG